MADDVTPVPMKDIRTGRFLIIDGIPCRVVDIEISSPGKHGSAKMRITGIGIFDGQKKTLLTPSHADGEAPVIKKTKAQVVSVTETSAQLMDSESYEIYDLPLTEEFVGKLHPGNEVEVIEAMGRKALSRTLGG
jgi:translation initiation factor 5A